jgi:hypothetical protein
MKEQTRRHPTDKELEAALPAMTLPDRIEAIISKYVGGAMSRHYDGQTDALTAERRIAAELMRRISRWLPSSHPEAQGSRLAHLESQGTASYIPEDQRVHCVDSWDDQHGYECVLCGHRLGTASGLSGESHLVCSTDQHLFPRFVPCQCGARTAETTPRKAPASDAPRFDPSNHHNALACPYCNPAAPASAAGRAPTTSGGFCGGARMAGKGEGCGAALRYERTANGIEYWRCPACGNPHWWKGKAEAAPPHAQDLRDIAIRWRENRCNHTGPPDPSLEPYSCPKCVQDAEENLLPLLLEVASPAPPHETPETPPDLVKRWESA